MAFFCSTALLLVLAVTAGCAGAGSSGNSPALPGTGGAGGSKPAPAGGSGGKSGTGGTSMPPLAPPPGPDTAPANPADASAPDADPVSPPDGAAPSPDSAAEVGPPDAGSPDGPPGGPLGTRVSLEDVVSARWVGTRRTVSMDGASKVFTAGFEAGRFGGGGNGHLIRLNIAPGKEYVFEYRIRFDDGYDFSRGGKIPGLAGGNAPSGCQTSTDVGFTARQMWREQGRLIGYIYDMDQRAACGNAIETGFNFGVGKWYRVKQRVKLNTGSERNGILQLWIDDRQVINRSNMGWMIEAPTRRIDRIFLDFFFGGSTADWSPRRNCSLSFADVFITKLAE
jgi:hypothetical protein